MKRTVMTFGATVALFAVFSLSPSAAGADVTCSVFEVAASKGAAPKIDPALSSIERKLKKPPLSSWNVFTLLGQESTTFAPSQSKTITLKRGKANIVLRDGDESRRSFSLAVDDQSGKRVVDTKVSISGGDFVVIGRAVENDNGHLIALGGCK